MPNPLEVAAAAVVEPEAPAKPAESGPSEAALLLEGVNQQTANELLRVFDEATRITDAKMGEIMWTLAMLQARVLASAELGDEAEWVARRFHELVRLALPAMMMAVERAKREAKGTPNDA
jgi:hypothetical protein